MNNKRILVAGTLAIIVTMMVGYALFSDTITINGTATAKGDFSITASCQTGITETGILAAYGFEDSLIEGGYDNDSCFVSGNEVSFSTNLKYPGALRFYTVSFKNTGSMDAVAQANENTNFTTASIDMEVRNNSDNSLVKKINLSVVNNELLQDISDEDYEYLERFEGNMGVAFPAIKTSTGEMIYEKSAEWYARTYDATTKDLDDDVYIKLEPNDTFILLFVANWDSDDNVTGYNYSITSSFKQPFKQMTSDMFQKKMSTCYRGC